MDMQRLMARLAKSTAAQRRATYKKVFAGEDGAYVLLDLLTDIGRVGMQRGRDMSPHDAIYANGLNDAVLKIAQTAGFEPYRIALLLSGLNEAKHAVATAKTPVERGLDHVSSDDQSTGLERRGPGGGAGSEWDPERGDPEPISPGASAVRAAFD